MIANTISIVVPVFNVSKNYLEKCISSVLRQTDPNWELVLCDDCSDNTETIEALKSLQGRHEKIRIIYNSRNLGISEATNRAIEFTSSDYIGFLDNDDELALNAIEEVRKFLFLNPNVGFLYTDEDKIEANGDHCEPYFKPDWSPEHILSCMYILHFLVVKKNLLVEIGMLRKQFDFTQDYDLVLRLSKITNNVKHIPKILYHWRKIPGSSSADILAHTKALDLQRLALHEATGHPVESGLTLGTWRVKPKINHDEEVEILILSNAKVKRKIHSDKKEKNLLFNCLDSIVKKSTYKNYSITVVIDRNENDQNFLNEIQNKTKNLFSKNKLNFYNYEKKNNFNYSQKLNFSWKLTNCEKIILLNDDTEVINPDWIESLCEVMENKGVGAVGGKLFHDDDTIQHAGIVLNGDNLCQHIYHNFPSSFSGHQNFAKIIRNFSAVTAACMLTKKSLLKKMNGFDEKLAIDFNDVDYCLRLNKFGFRTVFTPFCQMYHFENSSLPRTVSDQNDLNEFKKKWQNKLNFDPFYNINTPRDIHHFKTK